jgi:hypothetical protein
MIRLTLISLDLSETLFVSHCILFQKIDFLSAPFCNLQSRARTHAVLVIGLYELLGNTTT